MANERLREDDALRFSRRTMSWWGEERPAESSDLDGKDTRGWRKGKRREGDDAMRND